MFSVLIHQELEPHARGEFCGREHAQQVTALTLNTKKQSHKMMSLS